MFSCSSSLVAITSFCYIIRIRIPYSYYVVCKLIVVWSAPGVVHVQCVSFKQHRRVHINTLKTV